MTLREMADMIKDADYHCSITGAILAIARHYDPAASLDDEIPWAEEETAE